MYVTAVEALCNRRDLDERYKTLLSDTIAHLDTINGDNDDKTIIRDILLRASRESIRKAYMIKIKVLLGAEQAKMFDRLYGLRGKFLHDGLGRGTLAQAVNEAADIAVRLLDADLNSTGPRV